MTDQDIPLVDESVVRLPTDIREDIAERGRRDLYFFAKGIMAYRDMTWACHRPLCMFLQRNPAKYKLVLMPRGHFKSSLNIARTLQKVCQDPNQRILMVNEVADNAENFLSSIRQTAESSPVFRALYSSIIPKKPTRWSSKELEFNRTWRGPEPTISAMGMTSTLTSRHYTHILVDDPISEEAVKSPTVMSDAIERLSKFRSLMVKPASDTFDLVGTRWALYDVYSEFEKRLGPQMARFIRSVFKDGEPICPALLDHEAIAEIRAMLGEYMFSCNYLNNPRDVANQDFNIQDLRFWRWSHDEESIILYGDDGLIRKEWPVDSLDITTSVDLAMSEKITDDRNAIVTVGATPDGEAVVLETWIKRCTPLQVIDHLMWVRKRFHPRAVGIESVAYQKSLKYFLKAECERQGTYINVVDLKAIPSKRGTGNNSKEMRIRGLQPIAATGRLYILPTMHELRNEMADFPLGKHDDCLDALAHQLTMWRGLLSQERMAKYKASEAAVIQRIQAEQHGIPTGVAPIVSRGTHPRDIPSLDDLGIEVPQFGPISEVVLN